MMAQAIQEFENINIVGGNLPKTWYGDGFDVGDIVTYDVGYSMILPHFALIVRRTPCMIETIDLPTISIGSDGFEGVKRPVSDIHIDSIRAREKRRTRMGKNGSFSIGGHWTRKWDGRNRDFCYLD